MRRSHVACHELPRQRFAAAQRLEFRLAEGQRLGHRPGLAPQRDGAGVARQAVEVGAVEAGEGFEPVERAGRVEGLGVQLERAERRVAAGAAAGVLLQVRGVRRAVGAEEEASAAGGRRLDQRPPVLLALEHRQAVVVRPDAAGEDRVAVVEQVMRGDGRGGVAPASAHVLRASRVVMCSNTIFRPGKARRSGDQLRVDEDRLAVEQVDLRDRSPRRAPAAAGRRAASPRASRVTLRRSVTPASLLVVAPAG